MSQTSVVTPERFDRALSYPDYLASVAVNRDQFQQYYDSCTLTDDDAAFFAKIGAAADGPAKVLVIAEAPPAGAQFSETPFQDVVDLATAIARARG